MKYVRYAVMSLCGLICFCSYTFYSQLYLSDDDHTIVQMSNSNSHHVHHTQPLHSCHGGYLIQEFLTTLNLSHIRIEVEKCARIFYNKVPKCGSRTVTATMRQSGTNGRFTLVNQIQPQPHKSLNLVQQRERVNQIEELSTPLFYAQHLFYIDFSRFNRSQPLYINVIRDPVERVVSHYYYHFYGSANTTITKKQEYNNLDDCIEDKGVQCYRWYANVVMPYFCGHAPWCRKHTNRTKQEAMQTMDTEYLLVGLTEDLPAFFEILEAIYPKMFFNSTKAFSLTGQTSKQKYKTRIKQPLSEHHTTELRQYLQPDYQLYNYTKDKFYRILQAVRTAKLQLLDTS